MRQSNVSNDEAIFARLHPELSFAKNIVDVANKAGIEQAKKGAANSGNEPYSEYYASKLAKVMGLNHIDYSLASWGKSVCSVCI